MSQPSQSTARRAANPRSAVSPVLPSEPSEWGSAGVTPAAYPRLVGAVFAFQALLLVVVAMRNEHLLNTDGLAYVQLAGHYAQGRTGLMISGYWGPLLSWLMAPLLLGGVPKLAAARVVMALSALVFSGGTLALLRGLALPPAATLAGFFLAALASVFWSVEYIAPDLLVAGLACLALSHTLSSGWLAERRVAVRAGLWWGLAYLAKAVALPWAVASTVTLATLHGCCQRHQRGPARRALLATLLACGLVAGPWIVVLSLEYGRPTFSTTARIAHAVVGPPDRDRYHPFGRTLHRPEPGRLTQWEDPSRMPYAYWSPLESRAYLGHQLRLFKENAATILHLAGGLAPVGAAWWVGLGALALLWVGRADLTTHRWRLAVVPGLCLMAIYLPAYVQRVDQRYFYGAYPCVLALTAGLAGYLASRWPLRLAPIRAIAAGVLVLLFIAPWLPGVSIALEGMPNPASVVAQDLARRLEGAQLARPVAGSGMILGGRAGLYTAFLIEQPWLGDEPGGGAAPAQFLASGAGLVIVNRNEPAVAELDRAPGFRSLDPRLFASPEAAAAFPLKVYETVPP